MAADPQWVEKRFFPAVMDKFAFTDYSSEELKAAFEDIDEDGNGYLDREEVKRLLHSMDVGKDQQLDSVMLYFDTDKDGRISLEEFEEKIKKIASAIDPRVYTLAASMMIVGSSVGVIIPVMPILVQELGMTTSEFGLVISAFGLSKLLGNVPAAFLVEKYGRRPCLIVSLLGIGTAVGGIAFVHNVWGLAAARFGTGLGVSVYIAASTMYNTDISNPLNRARTLAPVMAGFSAGMAIGPAIGGALVSYIGVHPTFLATGGGLNNESLPEPPLSH